MRRFLTIISAVTLAVISAGADTWFPYPTAPENLPYGRPRANYIVEHFWDRCPWKSAYSSVARMQETMNDFAQFLPHAAADTTFLSINNLITQTRKRPTDLAALLKIAEATFYSDTAKTFSDEIYLPFASAGAEFKKFKPEQRDYYARQARIITNSATGSKVGDFKVTSPDGSSRHLNDTVAGVETYIFFFEQPGSDTFDRIIFSANISVRKLVDAGLIKPVVIYTGEPDSEWKQAAARLPEGWEAVSFPEAADYFDLRVNPAIYLADKSMTVISKLMPVKLLSINCEQIVKNAGL